MSKSLPVLFTALVLSTGTASAADLGSGQRLHSENCQKCHDDGVYKRSDRKISDMTGLNRQVKRCELSLGLTWFDEQVDDVVHYLNMNYYNFK